VIEGNTVANHTDQGIRLNSFTNTIVRNNVVYNNGDNQLIVEDKKGPSRNNVFEGNTFFALHPDQGGVQLTGTSEHGTFNNNYYCNPFSEVMFLRDDKRYSFARWREAFSDYDKSSRACNLLLAEYQITQAETSLIPNTSFDTGITDWKGSGAADLTHDTSQTLLTGGSLKVSYQGTGGANVNANDWALTAQQLYRLKFSVVGSGTGNIRLRINDLQDGTDIMLERFFAYDKSRKNYEVFFTSPVTTAKGKALLGTAKEDAHPYWLDDVSFEPVSITLMDQTRRIGLFTNPTANQQTFALQGTQYSRDLDDKTINQITLAPYTSQIVVAPTPTIATLLSSQTTYRDGEMIRVTLPPLPEGQDQYLGIATPDGTLFILSQLNIFNLFTSNGLPNWRGNEVAIEVPASAGLPRGEYPLYLLRVPFGIEPLANSQWWTLGVSSLRLN
jgi:parallel beta-helix repeat protein